MHERTPIPYQFAYKEAEQLSEFFCDTARPENTTDSRPYWKRSTYSLLSEQQTLIVSCLEGARGSLTTQIAAQMSAASALSGVLSSLNEGVGDDDVPRATAIVRRGIKAANADVYSYAHKMGAGGKVGATGFLSCFTDSRCSIARVGSYGVYACRDGRVLELFENTSGSPEPEQHGMLQRFIGANSQVLVDLISLELKAGDSVLFTSQPAETLPYDAISAILSGSKSLQVQLEQVQTVLKQNAVSTDSEGRSRIARNSFAGLLKVGAPVITLTEVLR